MYTICHLISETGKKNIKSYIQASSADSHLPVPKRTYCYESERDLLLKAGNEPLRNKIQAIN